MVQVKQDGSIKTTPDTENLAKRCGTIEKSAVEGLKRLKERRLIDILPKTRAESREVIVLRRGTQVYGTNIHSARLLSTVDLREFRELSRLRWGRDTHAALQRVGKVAGLFLRWMLAFRERLPSDTLA